MVQFMYFVEPSKIEVKKPPTPKVIYVKGKAVTKLSEHNSKEKKPAKPAVNGVNGQVGWIHRKDPNQKSEAIKHLGYNHEARNPLFANADTVVDTELFLLSQHYHPTVAVFAQNMIDGKPIKYNGEPLEDFTLIRFLDRFSFKNPKVSTFEKAPLFQHKYNPRGIRKIGPSSQDYVTKHIDEIPIDERYLHHFASIKLQNAAKKKKESGEKDFDDVASVDSDEFETIMDRFEPGEANDDFEVDFGEMFGPEKSRDKKGKKQKRKAGGDEEDDDEDLDVDEAEFMYSDDEGLDDDDDEEAGDDDEEEEVDDDDDELDDGDDDEIGEEDEESDGALPPKRQNKFDLDDMDSDEEADDYSTHLSYAKDALQSAEKIDDFMDFEDEDASLQKKKKKQKVKKPKGFKKRRKN